MTKIVVKRVIVAYDEDEAEGHIDWALDKMVEGLYDVPGIEFATQERTETTDADRALVEEWA